MFLLLGGGGAFLAGLGFLVMSSVRPGLRDVHQRLHKHSFWSSMKALTMVWRVRIFGLLIAGVIVELVSS